MPTFSKLQSLWRRGRQVAKGKIASAFGWQMVSKVVTLFNSVVITALVARYLGPTQFGWLALGQSLVLILTPVTSLGMDKVFAREYLRNEEDRGSLFMSCFLLQTATATILWAASLIYIFYGMESPDDYLKPLAIGLILIGLPTLPMNLARKVSESALDMRFLTISEVLIIVFLALARWVGIMTEASVLYFSLFLVLQGTTLRVIIFLRNLQSNRLQWTRSFTWEPVRRIWKQSSLMFFHVVLVAVLTNMDIFFVEWLSQPEEVGFYGAATRITNVLNFLPAAVAVAFFPSLVQSFQKDGTAGLRLRSNLYFRANHLVALAVAVGGILALPPAIELLYGSEYARSADLLRLLIVRLFCVFILTERQQLLIIAGNIRYGIYPFALGLLLNVALNLVLVPAYGATGAAVASMSSFIAITLLFPLLFSESREILLQQAGSFLQPLHGLLGKDNKV